MKRVLKLGVSILMVSMILMTLAGCGYKEAGDFLLEKAGVIMDLSEEGYQKKELFIYEQLGRYNIIGISYTSSGFGLFSSETPVISSQILEKVYFINYIPSGKHTIFGGCKNLKRIIRQETGQFEGDEDYVIYYNFLTKINQYIKSNDYQEYTHLDNVYPANVSFYINYESQKSDGYHWIDDFDYGTKITYIPEAPEREGYIFDGWYKEEECLNAWNFETDTLPKAILDEETGEPVYQETKLYAKWIRE